MAILPGTVKTIHFPNQGRDVSPLLIPLRSIMQPCRKVIFKPWCELESLEVPMKQMDSEGLNLMFLHQQVWGRSGKLHFCETFQVILTQNSHSLHSETPYLDPTLHWLWTAES